MSETRYTDIDQPEPGTAEAVEQAYEVELVGLNDSETAQVKEAISEAEFDGDLDELDVEGEIQQAQFAEENRAEAESIQKEQVEAADNGNYGEALDKAEAVKEELKESADEHGGNLDSALADNARDVEVLSEADFQQDSAEYFEDAAVDYADHAEDSADSSIDDAYDAAESADEYADQSTDYSDTGGDESIYTDTA